MFSFLKTKNIFIQQTLRSFFAWANEMYNSQYYYNQNLSQVTSLEIMPH